MLTAYLKRQWKLLLLLAGAVAVFAAVFALYSLPVEAVAYAGLLCLMPVSYTHLTLPTN